MEKNNNSQAVVGLLKKINTSKKMVWDDPTTIFNAQRWKMVWDECD